MTSFTKNIVTIILNIPAGKVMTYGQVARLAGNRRAARQVVRVLHTMSRKYHLPWHRVVNREGNIALKEEEAFCEQKMNAEMEGILVSDDGNVDLSVYQVTDEEELKAKLEKENFS
ncbi:methylated-DNA-protein-cysteine methyltransferase related protein [Alteribacillus persepolensis]|uniref:Methylated-DNA-protein-cysteine methyltransferase related protein n=1 Tax=Alteribacillus persepolensis TaxID=568899 RepID=A0A1G8B3I0_9BACI|nr:MGMT family protein [Alteribacillus persepolensis]SDH27694.1 methylated-DNA-protein-cysteine methyltransferase related protein [Alteribacillus persepolensis]